MSCSCKSWRAYTRSSRNSGLWTIRMLQAGLSDNRLRKPRNNARQPFKTQRQRPTATPNNLHCSQHSTTDTHGKRQLPLTNSTDNQHHHPTTDNRHLTTGVVIKKNKKIQQTSLKAKTLVLSLYITIHSDRRTKSIDASFVTNLNPLTNISFFDVS